MGGFLQGMRAKLDDCASRQKAWQPKCTLQQRQQNPALLKIFFGLKRTSMPHTAVSTGGRSVWVLRNYFIKSLMNCAHFTSWKETGFVFLQVWTGMVNWSSNMSAKKTARLFLLTRISTPPPFSQQKVWQCYTLCMWSSFYITGRELNFQHWKRSKRKSEPE